MFSQNLHLSEITRVVVSREVPDGKDVSEQHDEGIVDSSLVHSKLSPDEVSEYSVELASEIILQVFLPKVNIDVFFQLRFEDLILRKRLASGVHLDIQIIRKSESAEVKAIEPDSAAIGQ